MEDDHVDRPGVEVQQCMKLTGTNSSIGLIVLIDHAHRTSSMSHLFCPDAPKALRTGRATRRDGRWPCGADAPVPKEEKDVFTKTSEEESLPRPASQIHAQGMLIRSRMAALAPLQAHRASKKGLPKQEQGQWSCRRHQHCPQPTWWLWRGGRTRSLSEHGRETPQRRWYFVSRRGRVGRCQVC